MPSFFKNQMLVLSSFLLLNSFVQAGQPMWTVEPLAGSNPKQVIQDGASVTINYLVTNYSLKNRQLKMLAIPGVQNNGPCILAPRGQAGSQCTLSLTINGSQIPKNGIHSGPVLCQMNNNGVPNEQQCYRPSAGNELQIIRSIVSQTKHVTVGGYSDAVGIYPLAYYSVDSGQSWVLSQIPSLPNGMILRAVSCDRAANHCVAVAANTDPENLGAAAIVSEDGGKTWVSSLPILPYQGYMTELTTVACDAGGEICIAAGGYKINASDSYTLPVTYISNDGGNNWIVSSSVPSPVGDGGTISDIYCNKTASQCIVVGSYHDIDDRPIIYFSNDSGATWTIPLLPPVLPALNLGLLSVSCDQNELTCLAVGDLAPFNAYISNDSGQTWVSSVTPAPSGYDNFSYISCDPYNAPCVLAVGEKEGELLPLSFVSNNSMQSWMGPYTINPALGQIIQSLSCREGKCIILGSTISDSTFWLRNSQDNGVTWNLSAISPPSSALFSLLSGVF